MSPAICPNCGASVPRNAKACPECGSDEQTGWSDEAESTGIDLPDDSFDYDDFVKKEFGAKSPVPHGIKWYWWVIAVLLLVAFLFFFLR
jgi:uncharacterized membrane protein YvbJ